MAAASIRVNREWIATEFSKGIQAEQALESNAEASAASPPEPSLALLYHEIAAADARHRKIVETIATRYGYNPSPSSSPGISGAIHRLRERVSSIGASPHQRIEHDLLAKASAVSWCTAWIQAFQAIGDAESARQLAAIETEEKSHLAALQEGLNRLIIQGATGDAG
jgi:hypothetical protein